MQTLARVSAQALAVERVGVWLFADGGRQLRNLGQYVRGSSEIRVVGRADRDRPLPRLRGRAPDRRVLAVTDARTHAFARELAGSAFELAGTAARLDAPIIREGVVAGVVCYEHVGDARIWSQKDRDFAASTADMAALFLEQADRLEIEIALRERRENKLMEDKMAALSRLARAVAHDINNVFNVLGMTGFLLEESAGRGRCAATASRFSARWVWARGWSSSWRCSGRRPSTATHASTSASSSTGCGRC